MGFINVEIAGSFGNTKPHSNGKCQFAAMEHGHAAALGDAIAYLTSLLPAAIDLDHRLQSVGDEPRNWFGQPHPVRPDTEGEK